MSDVTTIIQAIEEKQMRPGAHPNFVVGDTVRVHVLIKEGEKERAQVFFKYYDLLAKNLKSCAEIMHDEMGKNLDEAAREMVGAHRLLRSQRPLAQAVQSAAGWQSRVLLLTPGAVSPGAGPDRRGRGPAYSRDEAAGAG